MANLPSPLSLTLTAFLVIVAVATTLAVAAKVPSNKTFKYVIYQDSIAGEDKIEYGANYMEVSNDVYSFATHPFQLCFFNTTPNAFILGLRAGAVLDQSTMRWVWDANRNHPVRDGATLTCGADGNLALVDADGSLAWHTNTANKGVTGIKLLPNGNLVLHDSQGKFLWQSFDHPTDTLMLGQSLKVRGLNKLVSRKSDADASNGPYSLVLQNEGLLTKLEHAGGDLTYGGWNGEDFGDLTFIVMSEAKPSKAYELVFKILSAANSSDKPLEIHISELTYIPRVSFIRIGSDGTFKGYSYNDQVSYNRWAETFSFFSKEFQSECYLPAKCGAYGVCDKGMCVACPTPTGLIGWSQSCTPPKTPACQPGKAEYYKIVGVDHFLNGFGRYQEAGTMKIEQCKERCDKDCKCLGYFYKGSESKCLLAPVLGTLLKDEATSVAYIKYSK